MSYNCSLSSFMKYVCIDFCCTEHVISVIVAAVVGCMLLVVMVILTAVVIAMCRKRCSKERKIGECVLRLTAMQPACSHYW